MLLLAASVLGGCAADAFHTGRIPVADPPWPVAAAVERITLATERIVYRGDEAVRTVWRGSIDDRAAIGEVLDALAARKGDWYAVHPDVRAEPAERIVIVAQDRAPLVLALGPTRLEVAGPLATMILDLSGREALALKAMFARVPRNAEPQAPAKP
jgi:hypothetical protein